MCFSLIGDDINEMPFLVNRLKAVTPGCEVSVDSTGKNYQSNLCLLVLDGIQ